MTVEILIKQNMSWKIRATFAGKLPPRYFISEDIRSNNPGWGDSHFNRTIEQLEFFMPNGYKLLISGMEKYNFFIEAAQSTKSKNGAKIIAYYFLGKFPLTDVVELWKVQDGVLTRDQKPFGHEWGGGPTRGWKSGVPGKPVFNLVRQ